MNNPLSSSGSDVQQAFFAGLLQKYKLAKEWQGTGNVDLHASQLQFFTEMRDEQRQEYVVELADLSFQLGRGTAKELGVVTLEMNGGLGSSLGLDPAQQESKASGVYFSAGSEGQFSILEAKFSWAIKHHEHFAKLGIIPWNSEVTQGSWDRTVQRASYLNHSKSYAELFAEHGIEMLPHEIQKTFPRFLAGTLEFAHAANGEQLQAPAGHGQVLYQLYFSGRLHQLVEKDYQVLVLVNADGLTGKPNPFIVSHLISEGILAGMVTTDRTPIDSKGGILLVDRDHLKLVEFAQVSHEQQEYFSQLGLRAEDMPQPFNTNTIYVNIPLFLAYVDSLGAAAARDLLLPDLIVNHKKVEMDGKRFEVEHLEGAIGSVILKLPDIKLFNVSIHSRVTEFAPVKRPQDVIYLYDSDAYFFDTDTMTLQPQMSDHPAQLDLGGWSGWNVLEKTRAAFGHPSMRGLVSLQVLGEVSFRDAIFRGEVSIINRSRHLVDLNELEYLPREGGRLVLENAQLVF